MAAWENGVATCAQVAKEGEEHPGLGTLSTFTVRKLGWPWRPRMRWLRIKGAKQAGHLTWPLNPLLGNFSTLPGFSHWIAQGWGCGGHVGERGSPQSLSSSLSLRLGHFSYWLASFHLVCWLLRSAAPEPRPWLNRERPWLSSRCPTCTMSPGGHGSTDGLSARTKRGDSLCHLYSCTRPAPRWAPGCHLVLFTYVFTFGCAASSPCTGSSAVAVGGGYSLAVTCRLFAAMAFLVGHRL